MSHPMVHAKNSVRNFGGRVEDYIAIHDWFDETKAWCSDMRHRAMRHHSQGIFECEKVFGHSITNSEGKEVMVRYIGEQHVIEDMGFIPTAMDWLSCMSQDKWMMFRDQQMKRKLEEPFGTNLPDSVSKILSHRNMEAVTVEG